MSDPIIARGLLADAPWLQDSGLHRVFDALEAAGGEARVAGGAIRNSLLGLPVADIDIATTLDPQATMAAGKAGGLGVHPTGLSHGTITLTADGVSFEVTTLRHDVETDGRHATVAFTTDWEADAMRRDFTMNALYCDRDGTVRDFTNGLVAIATRTIRFIGDAEARIAEDTLRILRFFRFFSQFGRGFPDAAGLAACAKMKDGLTQLSPERTRHELLKLLVAPRASAGLASLCEAGILPKILPGIQGLGPFQAMCAFDAALNMEADALLRLASLAPNARTLREPLRLTNTESARLEALAGLPEPGLDPAMDGQAQRALLYRHGAQALGDALRLAHAHAPRKGDWKSLYRNLPVEPVGVLPVSGKDLLAQGAVPGPDLGRRLAYLEALWIASDFTLGRDALLALPAP